MPYRKRSSSRRNPGGVIRKMGITVLVAIPLVLALFFIHLLVKKEDVVSFNPPGVLGVANVKARELEAADLTLIEDASSELNGEWKGLCEKNSINSVEDFRIAVQSDPVLLSHFAGFNWEVATIGKQDQETFAYVAHREGGLIMPTSKPIRLPKGDGYITDGVRVARTYCCNDINMEPAAGRPKEESTPVAIMPWAGMPEEWVSSGPFSPVDSLGAAPFAVVSSKKFSPSDRSSDERNSHPVPEPGSMLLMGTGLIVLVAACRKKTLRK